MWPGLGLSGGCQLCSCHLRKMLLGVVPVTCCCPQTCHGSWGLSCRWGSVGVGGGAWVSEFTQNSAAGKPSIPLPRFLLQMPSVVGSSDTLIPSTPMCSSPRQHVHVGGGVVLQLAFLLSPGAFSSQPF